VYTHGVGGHRLIVGVYVDDLIITGTIDSELKQFKGQMMSTFQMADLGRLHFYLGLEVNQSDEGITVIQGTYATMILAATGLASFNPCHTPIETHLMLCKSSSAPTVDPTEYRKIVGALRYLVNTRPGLAYIVGYISRFMERTTTEHLLAFKRVLRYVIGTVHLGYIYERKKEKLRLVGYSNSDLAGDINTCKSTTRVLYFFGDNVIS
jgi:hypothetical protein